MRNNSHLKKILLIILIGIFIACLFIPIEISLSECTDRVRLYDILVLCYWFAPLLIITIISLLLVLLLIREKREKKMFMKKTFLINFFYFILFCIEYCIILSVSFIVIGKNLFFSSVFWYGIIVGILQGFWWLITNKLIIHFLAYLINIYMAFYLSVFIQGKDFFTTEMMKTDFSIGIAPFALTIIPTVFSIFFVFLFQKNNIS